jgi:hypothetical protein
MDRTTEHIRNDIINFLHDEAILIEMSPGQVERIAAYLADTVIFYIKEHAARGERVLIWIGILSFLNLVYGVLGLVVFSV